MKYEIDTIPGIMLVWKENWQTGTILHVYKTYTHKEPRKGLARELASLVYLLNLV
jgi:hypothetical protein